MVSYVIVNNLYAIRLIFQTHCLPLFARTQLFLLFLYNTDYVTN